MKTLAKDWKEVLLDTLAKRGSGHTPDRKVKSYWDGGIKWVSLADSDKLDRVTISKTEYEISEDGIANSSAVKHPAGSVIISRDAGVGKSAVITEEMAVSQHFMAWQCGSELDNYFLYYWLQKSKPMFERIAVGSTIKTIGLRFFEKLKIQVPSFPLQKSIADFLLCWDGAISKLESLLAAKVERKLGLMQQLLTGQTRFKAFKGEKWRSFRLGDLLQEVDRYVTFDDDHTYKLASIRRRSEGLFFREALQGKDIKTKVMKTIHAGDFLLSKMQVVHGAWGLVSPEFDGMFVSDSYISLVPRDGSTLKIEFLNYLSQMRFMRHLAYICSHGVHIEKMTFNLEDFLHEIITIPPTLDEQTKIVGVLSVCDEEIELLQKQLEALKEQKRGLMQKLLTGEVRVKAEGGKRKGELPQKGAKSAKEKK
jgi:type I restriction enzyme, S subunit